MKLFKVAVLLVLVLLLVVPIPAISAPAFSSITPILGGEANTTTGATSDPNTNESNALGLFGCSGAGAVCASVSTDKYAGTYSDQLTSGGVNGRLEASKTLTGYLWYQVSIWAKDTTGNTGVIKSWAGFSISLASTSITTAWANYQWTNRTLEQGANPAYIRVYNDTNLNITLIDNVSIRPILMYSTFAGLTQGTDNGNVIAYWTINSNNQAGVVAGLDSAINPLNYVICYYDKIQSRGMMDKVVNGVYTNLIATSTAYVYGASVECRRAGTTYQLFYNGAQVGTNQTVSDTMGYLYGAFSTSSSNTYTGLSFTDNSTPTFTPTATYTPTPSFTPSRTFTPVTFTPTFTLTLTFTPTNTETFTPSFTPTITHTPTDTATPLLQFVQFSPTVDAGQLTIMAEIMCLVALLGIGLLFLLVRTSRR